MSGDIFYALLGILILTADGIIPEVECTASMNFFLEDECGITIDMETRALESVVVETTRSSTYYNNMDCMVYVNAPSNKLLEVKILQNYVVNSPGCVNDYLQIFDGRGITYGPLPGLDDKLCGSSILKKYYTSTTGHVTIRFKSDKKDGSDGFKILLSAFRIDPENTCNDGEFQCDASKRCISDQLVCDYNDDCSDASDDCSLSTGAIIGIAVGCVAVVIIVIVSIACCCCFRKHRHKSGSERQLSYDNSEEPVTPSDDVDYSEIHYYKPPSVYQQVYAYPPSVHSLHSSSRSDPYIITGTTIESPEVMKPRHVYITAPPETMHFSSYN